ncbi:hypothetical protein DFR74_115149 [Nocardia puris]|uniref:Uncharacterized protein n=1 Tax=Nocardia puris TaxID=208602 RepID=A0A366D5I7_9NOCA|nr:hypothetical protein DFR74_115149 [Nocardia puris]
MIRKWARPDACAACRRILFRLSRMRVRAGNCDRRRSLHRRGPKAVVPLVQQRVELCGRPSGCRWGDYLAHPPTAKFDLITRAEASHGDCKLRPTCGSPFSVTPSSGKPYCGHAASPPPSWRYFVPVPLTMLRAVRALWCGSLPIAGELGIRWSSGDAEMRPCRLPRIRVHRDRSHSRKGCVGRVAVFRGAGSPAGFRGSALNPLLGDWGRVSLCWVLRRIPDPVRGTGARNVSAARELAVSACAPLGSKVSQLEVGIDGDEDDLDHEQCGDGTTSGWWEVGHETPWQGCDVACGRSFSRCSGMRSPLRVWWAPMSRACWRRYARRGRRGAASGYAEGAAKMVRGSDTTGSCT